MVKDNKLNTHAYIKTPNFSPPFCQFINKGVQTIKGINNIFLPFCINQRNKGIYAIYIHEEERREVNSPAYMHLYEKR